MVVSSIPPRNGRNEAQWADLAETTCATHVRYCQRHGYDYELNESDVWDHVSSPWLDRPPTVEQAPIRYFMKIRLMRHYLSPERCRKDYDFVVWLDADCLVTNYDIPVTKWLNQGRASNDKDDLQLGDLILAYDVNGLHPTVIMARATRRVRGLMWAMSEAGQRMYQMHDWSENLAFRFFLATPPYRDLVWWHSAQDLCAMHPGLYPIPEDVRSDYEWTPESWTLHLSALPLAKRIEIAKVYVEQLGLLK